MKKSVIALVDCDNFFVSCERLFRPDLRTHPVLVLSSNDGCVISRSQEVKQLGISMGVPFFMVRDVCKREDVAVFSSNFELYRDVSKRVMSVLRRFSDTVETYSIDEAFLVLECRDGGILCSQAKKIRQVVLKEVGVPVTIGIGSTKTLAKVSAHTMKPSYQKRHFPVLIEQGAVQDVLRDTAVADVWGVGRRGAPQLERLGIATAHDLVEYVKSDAGRSVHVGLGRTVQELSGKQYFSIGESNEVRKSLMNSQSFGTAVQEKHEVCSAVARHARAAAEMLRAEDCVAKRVSVFVRAKGYGQTKNLSHFEILSVHTSNTLTIVEVAERILEYLYRSDVAYVKAGVAVHDIVRVGAQPKATLFAEEVDENSKLMDTLDMLQGEYGLTVQTAAELGKNTWRSKRAHMSPRYTTRWSDITQVKLSI